jgi:enolase
VKSYEEAQEMTIRLQTRLKEHVETMAGGKYEGVGLEGGLALVLEKDAGDAVPEQRLYRIMVEVIRECGFVPGRDVAIAIDPAATELANAYREKSGEPGARGMYLFWRHKDQVVMSRDDLLRFYEKIVLEDDIPLVSIEDGFAEDDFEGWKLLKDRLGDRVFVVGDDLVTTNDRVIEEASDLGLLNAVLVKSNQIGSVTETSLAMLTAIGLGNELVISHRSKSPNEDMEAHNALATGAVGMKCGGGTNTERLVKYGAVMERIKDALAGGDSGEGVARPADADLERRARELFERLEITKVVGNEAPTNAGIPTVGVTVTLGIPGSARHREILTVRGATSLGTSAGTGEAIHLVDVIIEDHILMLRHPDLFERQPDGSHRFAPHLDDAAIAGLRDPELSLAWRRSHRYDGKGCLNAVDHVDRVLRRAFLGKRLADLGQPEDIDRSLLGLELSLARERSRLGPAASREEAIAVMQRKGQLGMNAILSMSLALARLVGVAEGRELWQVIRDQMARAMARAIAKNGGLAVVEAVSPRELAAIRAEAGRGGALQAVLVERMSFDELVAGLRTVAKDVKSRGGKLHEVLRAQLGPYG